MAINDLLPDGSYETYPNECAFCSEPPVEFSALCEEHDAEWEAEMLADIALDHPNEKVWV